MSKVPFDIKWKPQIESGEYKVETRNGLPVRIICWDRKCGYPIVGLAYEKATGCESYVSAYADGTTSANGKMELSDDLFILTPEEELTPFEQSLKDRFFYGELAVEESEIKEIASELLSLAREQFIKDGYVIEKKAFRDAVENISDKHRAEMSVEYASHCKVENGVRRAIMDWDTFQKVAQKFIDIGKAEALKDLQENLANNDIYKVPEWLREVLVMAKENGKKEAMKDLPRWRYKKGGTGPILHDCIVLNKYGCIGKSPSGALLGDVWTLEYDELAKLPKEKPGFKED